MKLTIAILPPEQLAEVKRAAFGVFAIKTMNPNRAAPGGRVGV